MHCKLDLAGCYGRMTLIDFCGENGDLMANNFLMLIKLDADTMAFASLLVSILGAVAAIFAAFYANIAAFYAKKAASKRDLTRVEQNTQQVEHFSNKILNIDTPIDPQEKQETPQVRPQLETLELQPERNSNKILSVETPIHPLEERETPQAQSRQKDSQVQPQRDASQAQPRRIPISVEGEAMGEAPLELFLTLQDSSVRVSRLEMLSEAGKALGSSPCKTTDNALVFKSILAPKKVKQWWDSAESTSEGEGRSVLRVYLLLDESGREVYRDMNVSIVEGLRNVGITSLVVWTIKGNI